MNSNNTDWDWVFPGQDIFITYTTIENYQALT